MSLHQPHEHSSHTRTSLRLFAMRQTPLIVLLLLSQASTELLWADEKYLCLRNHFFLFQPAHSVSLNPHRLVTLVKAELGPELPRHPVIARQRPHTAGGFLWPWLATRSDNELRDSRECVASTSVTLYLRMYPPGPINLSATALVDLASMPEKTSSSNTTGLRE